jgi:hypothetical protein
MRSWILVALIAMALGGVAVAADKKHVAREADLPRFSYKVSGKLEDLVKDKTAFDAFAVGVRRDLQSVLDGYEIDDKATMRGLLNEMAVLDLIDGRWDEALALSDRIRELQEKPADKLLSGMQTRAIVAAVKAGAAPGSPAYLDGVGQRIAAELAPLPFEVVSNDIKSAKERAELIGEALILGNAREVLQPTVDKAGALSSDLAPNIVFARYALTVTLPLKQTLIRTYGAYLDAHKVEKPDIWAARNVELPPGDKGRPVTVAIWDSGVDTALFEGRLVMDGTAPAAIAFDKYSNPATGTLYPIPADLQAKIPTLKARLKGFSDLEANLDTPEATEVKQYLSNLDKAQYKGAIEELSLAGDYVHGTHVAGIALAGNPFARLAVARIEFGYTLLPDPCPSKELAEKDARNSATYVAFMQRHGVRVVNMSWGGSVLDYEHDLEVCGIGKTPDERKAIARDLFETAKAGLTKAMAGAPDILFVAAAGNSNQDASFSETIPAGIDLPNLLVVGAVDRAGDEAPFTSYGPTVKVHADGYQVDSVIPGGMHLALSGTSMAAPEVTNLAAKLLALRPSLTPAEVIRLVVETADKTADGRRTLINPKKAVEKMEAGRG